jgi:hypothetical protein
METDDCLDQLPDQEGGTKYSLPWMQHLICGVLMEPAFLSETECPMHLVGTVDAHIFL